MRFLPILLLPAIFLPVLAEEEDLPPVFAEEDGNEGDEPLLLSEPEGGEFDLAELFGEGLDFVGRLDLWARYYHTADREFGNYDEARFELTSRSGPTKVDLLLILYGWAGYDTQFSGGEEFDWRLDRANVSWFTDWLEIRLGRQRLAFGPGYVFNPSDLYVQPNFTDPTREDLGQDALLTTFYFGRLSGAQLIAVPSRAAADGDYGTRLFVNLGGFDLAASYYHRGAYAADQRAHFVGLSATGEITVGDWDGPGVWAEAGLDAPYWTARPEGAGDPDTAWRASAGLSYTFTEDFSALVEYFHDDAGAAEFADYDWLSLLSGDRFVLGRDYLFANLEYDLASLITLTAMGLVNLGDSSLVAGPGLRFNLSDNVGLTLGGFLFFGGDESEFGHGEIDYGTYAIPAYPHVAYVRFDAAF
jgi:hypothetical protein